MLDAFDFFLFVFVISDVAKNFNIPTSKASIAIMSTLAIRPVGALLFGFLSEKYGRRTILMLNISLFSLFEVLSAFSPNFVVFLIIRTLFGIAMGGVWGVASSLAIESIPESSRGLMSGIFQAGYPFGYLLAAACFGLFYNELDWRGLFIIGSLPIILIPYIWLKIPESPIWLADQINKKSMNVLPAIYSQWRLFLYLILIMAFLIYLAMELKTFILLI